MTRAALLFCLLVWPVAQQTPPSPASQTPGSQLTFRVEGNYVEIDAVVTDSKGAFVRDLKPEDFQITEDKKTRAVDVFTLVDIPLERPDAPLYRKEPVQPDVVTNEKPSDGRLYVIVLDGNHVQASDTSITKRAALQFIDQSLGANDQAAIVLMQTTSAKSNQEFTSDKAALRAAVERFSGEKVQWKAINVMDQINHFAGGNNQAFTANEARDPEAQERANKASNTIGALTSMSKDMAGIHGRKKAIVWFSEGIDYNTDDVIGPRSGTTPDDPFTTNSPTEAVQAQSLLDDMQVLYETASRANVAIYSVDPRGPVSEPDVAMQLSGTPEGVSMNFADMARTSLRNDVRRQVGTLRTFAEATGGIAVVGTNDFAGGFRRIVEDNSAYYVLGYHAPDVKPDGKFHDVTVKVTRPGLLVRAKKGYYAAKDAKPEAPIDPTVSLLNSPLPVSGLGLKMTLATMKGTAPNVHVAVIVEFSGPDIVPDPAKVPAGDKIDLTFATLDLGGKVVASGRKSMSLDVRPETRQSIAEHGMRLVTGFDVPPGRYQLRVAAHEGAGDKAGSVFWNLEVPDFTKSSIAMGNVAIAAPSAVRTPTSDDSSTLKDILPGPPTASREFTLEDTLAVYTEVYDNEASKPHTVDLSVTVRTDDGTQVFMTKDERNSSEIKADRGGYTYLARVPLQDLVPGRYVLTIEAKSRLGGDPVTKEIQFTVK
jgi:VWFA-related protein